MQRPLHPSVPRDHKLSVNFTQKGVGITNIPTQTLKRSRQEGLSLTLDVNLLVLLRPSVN